MPKVKALLKIFCFVVFTFVSLVIAVKYPSVISAFGLAAWAISTVYVTCEEIKRIR